MDSAWQAFLESEQGRPDAAIALEELWNDLALTRSFSLLCGYRMDLFDRGAQISPLPDICRVHSHVLPAADPERLHRAVDAVLDETLGLLAGKVYALVGPQMRRSHTPMVQLALMWVGENMPAVADRVLASARARARTLPRSACRFLTPRAPSPTCAFD